MGVEYWATRECGVAGVGDRSAQGLKQLIGGVGRGPACSEN